MKENEKHSIKKTVAKPLSETENKIAPHYFKGSIAKYCWYISLIFVGLYIFSYIYLYSSGIKSGGIFSIDSGILQVIFAGFPWMWIIGQADNLDIWIEFPIPVLTPLLNSLILIFIGSSIFTGFGKQTKIIFFFAFLTSLFFISYVLISNSTQEKKSKDQLEDSRNRQVKLWRVNLWNENKNLFRISNYLATPKVEDDKIISFVISFDLTSPLDLTNIQVASEIVSPDCEFVNSTCTFNQSNETYWKLDSLSHNVVAHFSCIWVIKDFFEWCTSATKLYDKIDISTSQGSAILTGNTKYSHLPIQEMYDDQTPKYYTPSLALPPMPVFKK